MSYAFHNGHGWAKGEMEEMNHNKKAKKTKKVRYVFKLLYWWKISLLICLR